MPEQPGEAERHETPEGVIENKTAEPIVETNEIGERVTRDTENADVPANYRYWQQHGHEWVNEYNDRKLYQIKYHIQEWMILDYARRMSEENPDRPLRVLEYGCGVGRHLANLAKLPNVDVYGFDQSTTMIEGCLRWTNQKWIDEHITIGEPTGRLPFDDDWFDLVYTSEVLVHVRPEDIAGRLQEMMRVARRQVLHIEPSEHFKVTSDVHFGCWKHDLVSAYSAIGVECQILPSGFSSQSPFRVVLSGSADETGWSAVSLGLMRRMEQDINTGRGRRFEAGKTQGRQAATKQAEAQQNQLEISNTQRQNAQQKRTNELQARVEELLIEIGVLKAALERAQNKTEELRSRRNNLLERIKKNEASAGELAEATIKINHLDQLQRELKEHLATVEADTTRRIESAENDRDQMLDELRRQIKNSRDNVLALERNRQADRTRIATSAAQQERFITRIDRIMGIKK
ncbi:MAG: hypothetical protein DRJ50_03430 [Actinobacteria bacterium]|nr:MAG: hypothetical protein DRJ50_03430 [Actinomycetota bacterium]